MDCDCDRRRDKKSSKDFLFRKNCKKDIFKFYLEIALSVLILTNMSYQLDLPDTRIQFPDFFYTIDYIPTINSFFSHNNNNNTTMLNNTSTDAPLDAHTKMNEFFFGINGKEKAIKLPAKVRKEEIYRKFEYTPPSLFVSENDTVFSNSIISRAFLFQPAHVHSSMWGL